MYQYGRATLILSFYRRCTYVNDAWHTWSGLEFPPFASLVCGGNSVNRIACESRT